MASRPKASAPSKPQSRPPAKAGPRRAPKRAQKRAARWDDAPRRGNPLGLLIFFAAAAGLVYTACTPNGPGAGGPPPPAASVRAEGREAERVIPRARYQPKRDARAAEAPNPPVEKPRAPESPRREAAPPAPEVVEEPPVIVEAPIILGEDAETQDTQENGGTEETAEETPEPAPKPSVKPAPRPAPKPAVKPAVKQALKPAPKPRVAVRGEFAANPAATGEVALTFDATYDDKPLSKILSALDRKGCRATFFLTGTFAERYPNSVKRIADAGMEVGNHSWSHPHFTKLSDAEIGRQLKRTNGLLEQITGQNPTLFRPPYGARDARVRRVVAEEGFETIYWALDSWDSVRKGITSREIAQRVLGKVQPGDVVLMHIGSQATADALPEILKGLDERGLRVVPVSELMAIR